MEELSEIFSDKEVASLLESDNDFSTSSSSDLSSDSSSTSATSTDSSSSDNTDAPVARSYSYRKKRILEAERDMTDAEFYTCFRMSRVAFEALLEQVIVHLPPGLSRNGHSLTPRERVLMFCMYLGGNLLYWFGKYGHAVSHGAMVENIHLCIDVFYDHFVEQFLQLPDERQARHESLLFSEASGFPQLAWGSIGMQY